MSHNNLLSVKNLSKTYDRDLFVKKQKVVTDLNLNFREGSCTGLLGHNGAGKTTTIRLILGLIRPDQGEILFNESPISQKDRYEIGYMPETNKLPLSLTCNEILSRQVDIMLPATTKSNKNEIVTAMLEKVELIDHRHKKISKLSKGMGRRIAWAAATIHSPKLLILDEPFSGLDPYGRLLMKGWINDLKTTGTTIVLCTHEVDSIKTMCDQVQIIRNGHLVYSTLDKNNEDVQINYCLRLSSVDEATINKIKSDHSLPEFAKVVTEARALSILFNDYQAASLWAKFCFHAGIVVLSFEDQGLISEDQMMKYFAAEKN